MKIAILVESAGSGPDKRACTFNMKKTYQTPRLTVHGTVEQITKATFAGAKLDRTLNAGEVPPPNLPISS